MANKRIDMRKVRELLRLKFQQGLSIRKAARAIGVGKTAAGEYIAGFNRSGLTLTQAMNLSDKDLVSTLDVHKRPNNPRYNILSSQFLHIEKELKRHGVTMQLLWQEYKEGYPDGYGYSQYCNHFYQWSKTQKVSMHIEHKAGDKMYVDFAGKKLPVVNPQTGEVREHEVFVAVLGCSQLSYIEAVPSQTKADWVKVNGNSLGFIGGVPKAIVPDCLKSAVNKSDKYEPEINETYQDFARHYNTVVLPARALHPKDKSLAENFVRTAYQRIYAPLRNQTFYSLDELNQALWEQLDKHNQMFFQGKETSRLQLFSELEKNELKPLPVETYEFKEFFKSKVQYNHHVYLKADKHYYSVPFQLTGKTVFISCSSSCIEIFYNNQRMATHHRNRKLYGYTTKEEHRPQNHQFVTKWKPEKFINWAKNISPEVEKVIKKVLESRPHPEQAFKSCMGILNLNKKHENTDLIKACKKALEVNCVNYKFIKNTIKNKTFNLTCEEEIDQIQIPYHENIRGKEFYN
jgi:transposase